jgi:hypothetical protein
MSKLSLTTIPWFDDASDALCDRFVRVTLPCGDDIVAIDSSDLVNGGGLTYLSVAQDLQWCEEDQFSLAQWCSMFPTLSFIDLGVGGVHVRESTFCAVDLILTPTMTLAHTHDGIMWFDSASGALDNGDETYVISFTVDGFALTRLCDCDTVEVVMKSASPYEFASVLVSDTGFPTCIVDAVLNHIMLRGGVA